MNKKVWQGVSELLQVRLHITTSETAPLRTDTIVLDVDAYALHGDRQLGFMTVEFPAKLMNEDAEELIRKLSTSIQQYLIQDAMCNKVELKSEGTYIEH